MLLRWLLLSGLLLWPAGLVTAQEAAAPPSATPPDASVRPPSRPEVAPRPPIAPDPAPPARPADAKTVPADATDAAPADPAPPADQAPATDASADPVQADAPQAVPAGPPAWQALTEDEFGYQSCLLGLTMLGVGYTAVAPITSDEDRDCGIARPLNITAIQPGIEIAGGATMRCDTARRLALWVRNSAVPAARHLPGAPRITEILPGSTYQCRARVGGSADKLSEHALGNAFDVAGLRLSDGTELTISPRAETGDMAEAVQKAMRYAACLQFTTVLGPGSNAAHDDHLHFDIAARKGGWRLCE